jgi:hypothetical protein
MFWTNVKDSSDKWRIGDIENCKDMLLLARCAMILSNKKNQVLSLPFCFTIANLKTSMLFLFFFLSKENRQNIVCQ